MKDEEKAKEIASKYIKWYQKDDESYGAYCGAIEMAEWKDNKFYLILACIKVSLDKAGLSGDKFIDEIKKQWEE